MTENCALPYSSDYETIRSRARSFAKRHAIDGCARSVLSHHTHFSKLKAKRARVFVGVLEHIKPGKIGARIEGHIDNCRCYRHRDNRPGYAGSRNFKEGEFSLGMRIAEVAPLYESVAPKYYGRTERVVSYLTEELVRQGYEVTLFASGDSVTKARLVPACRQSLRLDERRVDQMAHHLVMLEHVFARAADFDIVHFHVDYMHFPLSRRDPITHVTTLHGRLDIPDLVPLYQEFREMPVISISNGQRQPLPWGNLQATVYHGLPADRYRFRAEPGSYLAFLGRISPEKRVDRAIEIAKQVGMPLKIAAKIDRVDKDYFDLVIAPLLRNSLVEFVGEIGDVEKDEFLGNAYALLFPIDWLEPFGSVMIEAMACGTPVIAYRGGAVPELVEHGHNGFVVERLEDAVEAVRHLAQLGRKRCREVFEQRFTASRMAHDYVQQFERLIARNQEVSEAA